MISVFRKDIGNIVVRRGSRCFSRLVNTTSAYRNSLGIVLVFAVWLKVSHKCGESRDAYIL